MNRFMTAIGHIHNDERGHVEVGVPSLVAGIGAVILGIGAGGGGAVLAIIGGVVLGVGVFVTGLLRHRLIDYDLWTRLDRLEK
jgi:H+/gluconate symporter-like permease